MATNGPGAPKKIAWDPTGGRERRFRNALGASWELGSWEFIAQNGLLGGHLGNQNHRIKRCFISHFLIVVTTSECWKTDLAQK